MGGKDLGILTGSSVLYDRRGDYALAENSPCLESGENGVNMGAFGIGCLTINFPPSEFSLISPENNYQLFIRNNENQSLLFRWEISEDENETT